MTSNVEFLEKLIDELSELKYQDHISLNKLRQNCTLHIRQVFGKSSPYLNDLYNIEFFVANPSPRNLTMTSTQSRNMWNEGRLQLIQLFLNMSKDALLSDANHYSNRIFVVHGHDEAMRLSVEKTLDRLGLEAVILQEEPNQGLTIIEKFEQNADVGFAVALLSADDWGFMKAETAAAKRKRARQNVIFELGYFIGKLRRKRATFLYQEGVELPSDIQGLGYTLYDNPNGQWRFKLAAELKACGYDVDANDLL